MHHDRLCLAIVHFLLPMLFVCLLAACSQPIRVGILAGLTGPQSELGVAGRNGAIFRFEEENTRRGMNRFYVSIKDDQNDTQRLPGIVDGFRKSGITVVLGPFTSTIALALVETDNDLLFVSPTASADRLAGHDDMLVRMMGSVEAAAMNLARVMKERNKLDSLSAVWDINNRIYAEDYLEAFAAGWDPDASWINMSGTAVPDSRQGPLLCSSFDFTKNEELLLASRFLVGSGQDSVLIIASGSNAASIIRLLRREEFSGLIMVAGWAVTSDLSAWGTETLEGVVFSQQYDPGLTTVRFTEFKRSFLERFGTEPSFGAVFGYEAADLVIKAFDQAPRRSAAAIKQTILSMEPFETLQGNFQMDSFGDPLRGVFLFQFRSGVPVRME
jgi:branched-chain amino acid transport system substrate-binding protein